MRRKNSEKLKGVLIFIVMCLLAGVFIGVLFETVLDGFVDTYVKSDNVFIELIKFYAVFLLFILGFFIQIIIHEGGHLIFGLLTGYSFVSFRIGTLTFIKEEGGWKRKKFSIPGTGGQCLMMPPEIVDGKFPFVIYNLGGAILNTIFGVVPILIAVLWTGIPMGLYGVLILLGIAGIIIALMNGLPLKIGGIANDGSNVLSMLKDKEARRSFYLQLKVNGLMSKGERPRDMDKSQFELSEGADLSNPLNTSMRLMEYNCYLDKLDFLGGRQVLNSLEPYMDKIIGLYRYEIACEKIFLELVLNGEKDLVKNMYTKDLIKYMKACKGMISKKRVSMAYELLYKENVEGALKAYEEGKALAETYPIKGEVYMETMVMDYLKERINMDNDLNNKVK